ncbi:MAG TPA: hypothetical protein VF921_21060, partial [Vicinamibacterales bacterium]
MTKRRTGSWLGVAAIVAGVVGVMSPPAVADSYPRQAGITIAGYTFDIKVNDASDEFVVSETVEVRFLAAGVTSVELDLCTFSAQARSPRAAGRPRDPCAEPSGGRGSAAAPPPAAGGKGMTVTAVTADGSPLAFRHENDRVRVSLPRAFQPGDR